MDTDIFITAGKKKETGLYHGYAYMNMNNKWQLQMSDERGWPDPETAINELRKVMLPGEPIAKIYENDMHQ